MKFDPLVPPAEVRVDMSREPGAVFVGDLLAGGPYGRQFGFAIVIRSMFSSEDEREMVAKSQDVTLLSN